MLLLFLLVIFWSYFDFDVVAVGWLLLRCVVAVEFSLTRYLHLYANQSHGSIIVSVRDTCADWLRGIEPQDDPALRGKKDDDTFKIKVADGWLMGG